MGVSEQERQEAQGVSSRARRSLSFGRNRNRVWARLAVWALLLAFPLSLLLGGMGPAYADSEPDDNLDSLSFYRLSSSMTALFSTAQEPGEDVKFTEPWGQVVSSPASAGSMLGYPDEQYNVIRGWFDSRNAQSSNEADYESLVGTAHSGFSGDKSARDFALFGATLNGLGMDSTSTGLSLGFFSFLSGGVVLVLFLLAASIDLLWSFIIDTLIWINPFRMIYDAVSSLSGPYFADGMTAGEGAMTGFGDQDELPEPLKSIVELISSAYETLVFLSWTVMLPLFVGFFF